MMSRETRTRIGLAVALTLALGMALPPLLAAEDQAPAPGSDGFVEYVLNKIDDQYRGRKSHGIMELKVKTRHWDRTMKAESWSLGTDYSLVRILEPKKEQGTATLKAKNDLFMYLNKTGRTVKITSGMMGGSWMGSHFTNDDLVRHTRLADDFTVKASYESDAAGIEICQLALTPKPDAPVVWGKIEVAVRQSDLQPLSQRFYDEDGREARVLEFSDHREVDGRVMPMKMVMRPLDSPGEFTQITWKKIDFDVNLTKSFFTLQKLKSL